MSAGEQHVRDDAYVLEDSLVSVLSVDVVVRSRKLVDETDVVGVDVVAEVILEHTRQLVAQRADRLTDVGVEVFVQRLLFDFLANLRRRRVVRIIWVGLLLLLL